MNQTNQKKIKPHILFYSCLDTSSRVSNSIEAQYKTGNRHKKLCTPLLTFLKKTPVITHSTVYTFPVLKSNIAFKEHRNSWLYLNQNILENLI